MSNLENNIKDCITKELENGIIEKVLSEELEKCIEKSISDMFSWGGEIKKVIEDKIKSVMIPYLEQYDYSEYITKLDSVLVEVLKNTTLENKRIIENFKCLMTEKDVSKEIKMSEIWEAWKKYCKENIDKDKLDFEGEGTYITVTFNAEEVSNSWGNNEIYMCTFECEEDEDLKYEFEIDRWSISTYSGYSLRFDKSQDLRSLKTLSKFEVLLMQISQGYSNVNLDIENESDDIFIEYEC